MSNINERACTDTYTRPLARSCCVVTDHSGMSLRTHFQPDLTIVEAHGAVDACNAARLSDCVDDLASRGRPLNPRPLGCGFLQRRRLPSIGQDRRKVPADRSAMGTGYQRGGRPTPGHHAQ